MMFTVTFHSRFLLFGKWFILHYVLAYVGFLPPPLGLVARFLATAFALSCLLILLALLAGTHLGYPRPSPILRPHLGCLPLESLVDMSRQSSLNHLVRLTTYMYRPFSYTAEQAGLMRMR